MSSQAGKAKAQPHSDPADRPVAMSDAAAFYMQSGYDLPDHAAHLIRRAHQRATTCFQTVMSDYNLTPTQHAALATLLKHGELSQNQLGRLTAMDPSTISMVVRKLMKDGLVQGAPSSTDQRLSILSLTKKGIRFTMPLLELSLQAADLFLSPLTARERVTFARLVKKLAGSEPSAD
ncbi:MarR family winged helix-turn-helix transcriptional regulator [Microvirga antarctica]|uniref:MarR family winged helix-turn-helix transcriptional regulator n=1 Tax=Microvirga antarctica TaxID=2819233 RepID=UPI001B316E25|nr:MarR family transcriptional regulator [Microvirga antarctica]